MSELFQDRRSKGRGGEKPDGSLNTLISIYLLILAFLVTMYSASSLELSKAGATMNAVQAAFHGIDKNVLDAALEYEVSAEDFNDKFTTRGGMQPFFEEGARLIQSSFSLEGGINISEGQGLLIDIPANRIFIGVSHLVRPEFEKFSIELTDLINAAGSREIREIEIVFGTDENGNSSSSLSLAQKRLHSLARNLIDQGMNAENIIMGVRAGSGSNVTIGFYSRVKSGSELNFTELKGGVN